MTIDFEIVENIKQSDLTSREKRNLIRIFEYTQYLLDDDDNLTKTLNLNKKSREKILSKIEEIFEK